MKAGYYALILLLQQWCARACEVMKHFTSLKAKIVVTALAVEAAQLIQTAVTFSLSEDEL